MVFLKEVTEYVKRVLLIKFEYVKKILQKRPDRKTLVSSFHHN